MERHPDRLKETQLRGRQKIKARDPDYFRRKAREWNKAHPEKVKANSRAFNARHKDERKALNRERILLCKDSNAQGRTRARKYGTLWEDCASRIRFLRLLPFCQYCFTLIRKRHIDHVIPFARGGTHTPGNLVASCASCNCSKNDNLLGEWNGREAYAT